MRVHGEEDRFVSRRLREQGMWEPCETSLVLSLLRPGDVFVDVGANIGYFSIIAASAVGDSGQVFAFEPDPSNFALLEANGTLNGLGKRIRSARIGLAATDGEGSLYLSPDNLGDHQIHAADPSRDQLPITLRNGSDYLRPRLQRLDLLKVDTQGAEFEVIAGLLPLLNELPCPPRILIELTPLSLRQAGASGRALIELLASLDQPLWIVDHVEHRLVQSSAEELARWCDNVDAVPGDAGFMNILSGPARDGDLLAWRSNMKYRLYAQRIFSFNWAESVAFYRDTLGLPLKFESEDIGWAEFDLGGVSLAIERQDPECEEAGELVGRFVGISLRVDDIQAVYRELISKGVEFAGQPEKQAWGGTLAHFIDPDQNTLTLLGE